METTKSCKEKRRTPRIRRMRIKEKKKKEHCELDHNKPVIKGDASFSGIALIDNDPYIPGGNGAQWYTNQNQFYRQIRFGY